jgi:outer membrane receptor for ferrienterochelin and colicins
VVPETTLDFVLRENNTLDEVVITGTMKPVSRLESPVPVEVYSLLFFKKNPTTNIFEALQNEMGASSIKCSLLYWRYSHQWPQGPYTSYLLTECQL